MSLIILALLIGLMAYIRLAPSDPAQWHIALPTDIAADGQIRTTAGSARAAVPATPQTLTQLDAIARATPRSSTLAGSAAEGRITWVLRSAAFGFPDYITAQITETPTGPRLDLHSRLRFGRSDFGVNAARLKDWLSRL